MTLHDTALRDDTPYKRNHLAVSRSSYCDLCANSQGLRGFSRMRGVCMGSPQADYVPHALSGEHGY